MWASLWTGLRGFFSVNAGFDWDNYSTPPEKCQVGAGSISARPRLLMKDPYSYFFPAAITGTKSPSEAVRVAVRFTARICHQGRSSQ